MCKDFQGVWKGLKSVKDKFKGTYILFKDCKDIYGGSSGYVKAISGYEKELKGLKRLVRT